jgi:hypothetical protein
LGPPTHGYHISSSTVHNNVYSMHEHREYTFLQKEINMMWVRTNALNHELKKKHWLILLVMLAAKNILCRKEYYLLKYHTKVFQRIHEYK